MDLIRYGVGTAILAVAAVGHARQSGPPAPLPEPSVFLEKVRQTLRADEELQRQFVYIEHRRDVRISKLGKVNVGPLRTFEVYPSEKPGGAYKRLVAVDGVPLSPAELARRDEAHEQDLAQAAERVRTETPAARAERIAEERKAEAEQRAILEDGLAVYEPTLLRREYLEGHPVIVIALSPRPDARVSTREGRWMKHFGGTIWVSEVDYQIARLDMRAAEDVTIGWGIIGRVHQGSRLVFARQRYDSVWLPARMSLEATGRTLLLRKFAVNVVTTYSGYRRVRLARD